jgi:hypothetical protein
MRAVYCDDKSCESVDTVPEIARARNRLVNFAAAACAVMLLQASAIRAEQVELEEVAAFPTQQVTGVTVSAKGRVFVNFPLWSDDHTISVAEVVDGKPKPFPDEAWNAKAGPPAQRWVVCRASLLTIRTRCGFSRSGFAENRGGGQRRTQARKDRPGDKQSRANNNLGRKCRAETFLFK